jgi:polar amino acid transport system permease protein
MSSIATSPSDPPVAPRLDLPPVPSARPGRWIAAGVMVVLVAWFAWIVVTNPNFQWAVVGKYLFSKEILHGVKLTIELTASAMAIGVTLGARSAPSTSSRFAAPRRSCNSSSGST